MSKTTSVKESQFDPTVCQNTNCIYGQTVVVFILFIHS